MTVDMDTDLSSLVEVEQLRSMNAELVERFEYLAESIAQLEVDADNVGWRRMVASAQNEFSEDGLRRIVEACQVVGLKNPLLSQALKIRAAYTWAQGVTITAVDSRVDKVVQDFINAEANQVALFGPEAAVGRDVDSGKTGNIFIAAFTDPYDGSVELVTIPFLEIGRTIRNPDNRLEPWFYRHDVTADDLHPMTGHLTTTQRQVWHPAIGDHPKRPRVDSIAGKPVLWDAPVLHMAEDRPDGWCYGIPVAYSAVDWAIAYKDFLSDWATYMKALSRIAWRLTGPGRKQAAARAALAAAPALDPFTGEAQFAGATATLGMDQKLEAIPKAGASLDSNSGFPLANMVAVGIGIPVTTLLGDPSRGDRSAADNLDRPTELRMQNHQKWWGAGYKRLIDHAIDSSVRAPKGHLRGSIVRDHRGRETVILANNRDRTVRIHFPDLDDITPSAWIDAIVKADQSGKVPPLVITALLADTLGWADVASAVAEMTGTDGKFKPADGSQLALELDLMKAQIEQMKAGAAAAKNPTIPGRDNRNPDAPAENPNDPDPSGADPAESPTKARNRARTTRGGNSGRTQADD